MSTYAPTRPITTTTDLRQRYQWGNPNGHWFDADTLRWFGSRIHATIYRCPDGGALFVTSEYTGFDRTGRAFTVRRINPDGWDIETVGEFLAYASRSGAHAAAARLAPTFDNGAADDDARLIRKYGGE